MPNPVAIGSTPSVTTPNVRANTPFSLLVRARTWLRRSRLDAAIARGVRRPGDPALALREAQLVAAHQRRRLAMRLEEIVAVPARPPAPSSMAPVDRRAVAIATPVLSDLIVLLRSGEAIEPRGMALAWRMLTDPGSSLYEPDERGSSRNLGLWRESAAVLRAVQPA